MYVHEGEHSRMTDPMYNPETGHGIECLCGECDPDFEFQDDCERMQRISARHGMALSLRACKTRWEALSGESHASWICLPQDDDELWRAIQDMMKPRVITRVMTDGVSTKDGLS